jgi:hypothetical protein
MDCEQIQELLLAKNDVPDLPRTMSEHVAGCTRCALLLRDIQSIERTLRPASAPRSPQRVRSFLMEAFQSHHRATRHAGLSGRPYPLRLSLALGGATALVALALSGRQLQKPDTMSVRKTVLILPNETSRGD